MTLISNWSKYPVVDATYTGFTSSRDLANKLSETKEFIARGNGLCYGDASLNDYIISCLDFNKFIAFDKKSGIIEMQAGVLLDDILKVTVPAGCFYPLHPAPNSSP